MIQNLILTTIAETDFREIVSAAVRSELAAMYSPQKATAQSENLTRMEIKARYKISLPTIHKLTMNGTFQGFRLGGRVLYKSEQIESSLQAIKTIRNR